MKTYNFLIILPFLTLTACTQWEKPGAGTTTRDAEYAECKGKGYERFPPDMVRDFEFTYENQYKSCKKDKKDCQEGYRYEKQPSFKTVQNDRNEAARSATIEACMYGKGWHEKTYYWPQY